MLLVSSPSTPARRFLRGRGRGRTISTPVRPELASPRNQIQPHLSKNDPRLNASWTVENDGSNKDFQGPDISSPYESTTSLRPLECLSGTGTRVVSRGPTDSVLFDDTSPRLRSAIEPNSDGSSISGSFENLSASNKSSGTRESSETLWVFPLVGSRPRLDGTKHYDLVCERDHLLLNYGFLSQAIWTMEERLFNDPDLNDRQKAMSALWTRWLALYRVDFIENPRLCCINFIEDKHELVHHAAGWHAFRSWILALKYNCYLTQNEMISIIKLYNQKIAQAGRASSLPEAQST